VEGLARLERWHASLVSSFENRELMTDFEIKQHIHQAILSASGNDALSKTYDTLPGRIQRYRYVGNLDATRWSKALMEHEHIMVALRDRDALLLRQILASHLDNGWQVAKRMTEGNYGEDDPMPVNFPRRAAV